MYVKYFIYFFRIEYIRLFVYHVIDVHFFAMKLLQHWSSFASELQRVRASNNFLFKIFLCIIVIFVFFGLIIRFLSSSPKIFCSNYYSKNFAIELLMES